MNKVGALAVCFMFFALGSCLAESEVKNPTWELTAEASHITYEEPDIMEEKGIMYGLGGACAYHSNIMLKGELRGSFGQVDYSSPISGTIDNINDYIIEARGLWGYDFSLSEASTFTPYIGAGYRYLNDDTKGKTTSTGALGYLRESNYFYSPIGIEAITKLENSWSLGLTVEYDYLWQGIQKSHLSDVNLGFNDLENKQEDGYGARASLKFKKQGKDSDLVIEPFVRYWNIDQSKEAAVTYAGVIIGTGYEPKNHSTEIGIKISTAF